MFLSPFPPWVEWGIGIFTSFLPWVVWGIWGYRGHRVSRGSASDGEGVYDAQRATWTEKRLAGIRKKMKEEAAEKKK